MSRQRHYVAKGQRRSLTFVHCDWVFVTYQHFKTTSLVYLNSDPALTLNLFMARFSLVTVIFLNDWFHGNCLCLVKIIVKHTLLYKYSRHHLITDQGHSLTIARGYWDSKLNKHSSIDARLKL